MSIHSQNEQVILEFGLKKPAFRIIVNSPTTHGSIGLTTGLDPAMTLGCGGYGGNITSDNITPRHLLNIKRLAYEITPAIATSTNRKTGTVSSSPATGHGISAAVLTERIDQFLGSRGYASRQTGPALPASVVTAPPPPDTIARPSEGGIGSSNFSAPAGAERADRSPRLRLRGGCAVGNSSRAPARCVGTCNCDPVGARLGGGTPGFHTTTLAFTLIIDQLGLMVDLESFAVLGWLSHRHEGF